MLTFSDIVFSGEKDQLAQALKNEEAASKSYAGELDKLREELAAQATAAAQAKDGFDTTERRLRADIAALRQENESLKEANVEQQKRADVVAERNARWLGLAQKANERMEGWFPHAPFRCCLLPRCSFPTYLITEIFP